METDRSLERGLLGLTISPCSGFLLCDSVLLYVTNSGLRGLAREDERATSTAMLRSESLRVICTHYCVGKGRKGAAVPPSTNGTSTSAQTGEPGAALLHSCLPG